MQVITNSLIALYKEYLINEEKSPATIQKYIHDITCFKDSFPDEAITKVTVLSYKSELQNKLAPASVNSVISSLNSFFSFINRNDLKVKSLKLQRSLFTTDEKNLTKKEYDKLLNAAKNKGDQRLYLLMQTICATGIRISELKYITVSSLSCARAEISNKGKRRIIFLPALLCKMLKEYATCKKIKNGPIFITKNGRPLDRSNIWSSMKKLCQSAGVSETKVFPHNLRHLFARTYYSIQKDIVRLADILGHSSINTVRIYTQEAV